MESIQLSIQFYAGLLIAFTLIVGTGIHAARMVRTADDYSVGGHSSNVTIIVGVFTGTLVGGAATIGTAQFAYHAGLSAWWFILGVGIGLSILGLFYVKPLRKKSLETISQFLVLNYGERAGTIASISSSIGIFFSIVASFLSATHLLAVVFDFPILVSIVLLILMILISLYGGLQGVGLVGMVKMLLIYITVLIGGCIVLHKMDGLSGFLSAFPTFPWFSLMEKGIGQTIGDLISMIAGILVTQTYIQAVYAARSTRVAVISCFTSALIIVPLGLPVIAIGMFMRTYHPDILPINALALFMLWHMPPLIGGAGIMALLISSVGSAAGLALGVGTLLSRDLLGKRLQQTNGVQLLRAQRLCVCAVTCVAAAVTYINLHAMVLDLSFYSMAFRAASLVVPLSIAIFFSGKLTGNGAIRSMGAGIGAALLTPLLFGSGVNPILPGILCSLAIAVVMMQKSRNFKSF